ncbi:hypothetical protein BpHYR1_012303 [Brachionus plicatilis]|uniref:Uncharacterized protein n=1 Tax=Brachionus plicatilis TaxID=10195 RepID=A0A3M7R704_BRAPC|nr:hypothetical protein BpHYR1_012303 [Brachionus plicatilis]
MKNLFYMALMSSGQEFTNRKECFHNCIQTRFVKAYPSFLHSRLYKKISLTLGKNGKASCNTGDQATQAVSDLEHLDHVWFCVRFR